MNWKKIGLFILFLILSSILFGIITLFGSLVNGYLSFFLPIFFVLFAIFLFLIIKEYSKKRLIILISIIIIYWLIILIPFPKCDSWGKWGSISKECTCFGLEKTQIWTIDAGWSQCVGIPLKYECSKVNLQTNIKEIVPCE